MLFFVCCVLCRVRCMLYNVYLDGGVCILCVSGCELCVACVMLCVDCYVCYNVCCVSCVMFCTC